MDPLWLGSTAILSTILGYMILRYLTVHPMHMARTGFQTGGILVLLGVSFFTSKENILLSFAVAIIFAFGSYLYTTQRFLNQEDKRYIPEITRSPGNPGFEQTAVVYFTHGEPETFNPISWINQFKEFDKQGIRFIPFPLRPLFIQTLRRSYLRVGKSNHRRIHHKMLKSLERAYQEQEDQEKRFYISFLDDEPRPDAAVIQALNDGASRIIVCEVFLSISNHTAEGEKLIKELDIPEKYGVSVEFTRPLWDSSTLKSMFIERANNNLGNYSKVDTGILLVGHGQPDEWDEEWPTETEHEIGFRQDILKLFADNGYMLENLSLAWMEFKEPKPAAKVEEFIVNGVKQVLYFSAAISADAIHSQYNIPELIHKANIPKDIVLKNLGAWNNDPIVIKAIKEKIDELIEL